MSQESFGFTELSQKITPKIVDVIAVHGLQGDAIKTWEHTNGKMWLRDFLSPELPFARIMTFGYDSTVLLSKSVADIEDKALELLNQLSLERTSLEPADSNGRPIVFIGHSLGGILVKKSIILAHERSDEPAYKDVLGNTKGIAFLGTPHRGSDGAWWGSIVANIVKDLSIGTSTNPRLLSDLKKDSSSLGNISSQFVHRTKGVRIYTFYETKKTGSVVVVDKTSATMGLPNEKLFAVDADHRDICKFSSAESSTYRAVGSHVALLVKGVLEPVKMALSREYSECMRALDLSDPNATRYNVSRWVQGTCTWLMDHPQYRDWINGSEKAVLWVTGAPGSGKTVLSSFIIDQMETIKSPRNVSFFFADESSTSQRSAVMLLRGLLYQILDRNPSLFKHVQVRWKRNAEKAFEELGQLWRFCTACFDDPLMENAVFVLDALDECASPDCERLLTWITQYFASRASGSTQVKFFLTSRPEIRISDILDTSTIRIRLEIHSDTDWLSKDIELFIADTINTLPALKEWPTERKEHLRHRLVQNADRTFLWVSLVLQKLTTEAMLSENAFAKMLSAIPDQLEGIYHNILTSIPNRYREAAREMLSIIAMAQNPLDQEQLRECWAIQSSHLSIHDMVHDLEPDIRRTVGLLCGQIIRWEKAKPKVRKSHRKGGGVEECRLVHQSAKGFLFSDPALSNPPMIASWYHLDLADATRIIANKCMWFIDLKEFSQTSQAPKTTDQETLRGFIVIRPDVVRSALEKCCKQHPFLHYAVHHWAHHFREYERLDIAPGTTALDPTDYAVALYNNNVPLRAHWFMKMLRLTELPLDQEECQIPVIVFCAYNGHATIVPKLMVRTDINASIAQMKFSALHAAVLGKHLTMVNWLLANEAGTEVNDAWNRTPLHFAARRNHEQILLCLIHHHANTSAKDQHGMTPIQDAQERGFNDIAKILARESKETDDPDSIMPVTDQTQDTLARFLHDSDEFDLGGSRQHLHDTTRKLADGPNGQLKNDRKPSQLSFPELELTRGSSDSSERKSLSAFGSDSSLNDSRRRHSRAHSRHQKASSGQGSFGSSSSVGSFRRSRRGRSLDLRSKKGTRITRRSSSGSGDSNVPRSHPLRLERPDSTILDEVQETVQRFQATILSMNGGCADSYCTLLVLRELMKAIEKVEVNHSNSVTSHPPANRTTESSHHPLTRHFDGECFDQHIKDSFELSARLPYHYFDYIAGCSFGGLVAIMLGRLRMNINDCIDEYGRFCTELLGHRSIRLVRSLSARHELKERLRNLIKDIVHRRLPRIPGSKRKDFSVSEKFAFDEDKCKTAVLTLQRQPPGIRPKPAWIQTYDRPRIAGILLESLPNGLPVWQAALASIAPPSHYNPIEVDGEQCQDICSLGYVDPCAAIYAEVCESDFSEWTSIFVSIGTGKSKRSFAKRINTKNLGDYASPGDASNVLHAAIPRFPYGEPHHYYRFAHSESRDDWLARGIHKSKVLRARIEERLSRSDQDTFEVPRGSDSKKHPIRPRAAESVRKISSMDASIKDSLRESAKGNNTMKSMTKHMEAYLLRDDVQTSIAECAQALVERRRYRAKREPDRWRRDCFGLRFHCLYESCIGDDVEYADRDSMREHLLQRHREMLTQSQESSDEALMKCTVNVPLVL